MFRPLLATFLIIAGTARVAPAETYTVGPETPGAIQALIDLVLVDGDVIQLEAGTYVLPAEITILDLDIEIHGANDPMTGEPATVLDGQAQHRIIQTADGVCSFQSLVLANGRVVRAHGGAVLGEDCSFENCWFLDNASTWFGGAVFGRELHFDDCVFARNTAGRHGGAVYGNIGPSAYFSDCAFIDNSAGWSGGAVYFIGRTFLRCSFDGNIAKTGGGAVMASTADFEDCDFTENQANYGGALYLDQNAHTLIRSVMTGNIATEGGAVHLGDEYSATLLVSGCTISGNSASATAGGIRVGDLASLTVLDSAICDNSPDDIAGGWTDAGGNDACGQPPCPADMDGDGVVSPTELGLVLALWGTSNPLADLDGNGIVESPDLGIVLASWGPCR